MRYSLAIDIGASSGRHILGGLEDGKLRLWEVHRFPNGMTERHGRLCWDVDALFAEVILGLQKCAALGKIPQSVGIDTWGVDFVLLDAEGNRLDDAVAYRDSRTDGMDMETHRRVSEVELYARTGIQKQKFNTLYQLMALKAQTPSLLERAEGLLMIPDYLHYRLCGARKTEYTNATTTGLCGAASRDWDGEAIGRLGFPRKLFQEIAPPGTVLGGFIQSVRQSVGFDCAVVLPPTHDTASAFLSVPSQAGPSQAGPAVTISSGTWSLLGALTDVPVLTEAARNAGFTNEGGTGGQYRFLKNIMGLWMVQSIRSELLGKPSFDALEQAARSSAYHGQVNVNDAAFFAPESMTQTVIEKCREAGFPAPNSTGDILRCVYRSLAAEYARSVKELEGLTGRRYTRVSIVGGGCQDRCLNELTAQACGLPVFSGPVEGTAVGNLVCQMIRSGQLPDEEAARAVIRNSFEITEVQP